MPRVSTCPNFLKFFKAICDENRHAILLLLKKHKEMNVTSIVGKTNISQPTVSHHLKILTDSGVISHEKKGKEILYKLNKHFMSNCCQSFLHKFCEK